MKSHNSVLSRLFCLVGISILSPISQAWSYSQFDQFLDKIVGPTVITGTQTSADGPKQLSLELTVSDANGTFTKRLNAHGNTLEEAFSRLFHQVSQDGLVQLNEELALFGMDPVDLKVMENAFLTAESFSIQRKSANLPIKVSINPVRKTENSKGSRVRPRLAYGDSLSGLARNLLKEEIQLERATHPRQIDSNLKRARDQQMEGKEKPKSNGHLRAYYGEHNSQIESLPFLATMKVGHFGTQGERPSMEDAVLAQTYTGEQNPLASKGIENFGILAVFDGHGGAQIANRAKVIVPETIKEFLSKLTSIQLADEDQVRMTLENAFSRQEMNLDLPHSDGEALLTVHERLSRSNDYYDNIVGSTAVVAVFLDRSVYLVNLGDSRAILVNRSNQGIRVTYDHLAKDQEERRAAESRGGIVNDYPLGARLESHRYSRAGALSLSRALGDWDTPGLGRKPDITHFNIEDANALILECDGVHDSIKDSKAAAIVSSALARTGKSEEAAKKLAMKAWAARSFDNISVIVAQFEHLQPQKDKNAKATFWKRVKRFLSSKSTQ